MDDARQRDIIRAVDPGLAQYIDRINELETQRNAALHIHRPVTGTNYNGDPYDYNVCDDCLDRYPCDTARALGATDG